MSSPVWRISGSMKPRVLTAGEPTRSPLATLKEASSNGTTLRLAVMLTLLEEVLALEAVEAGAAQVDEREVHVRAAGDEAQAALGERLGQHGAVLHDLALQPVELLALGDAQAHRLGGDDVHQRAALHAGEHGAVDGLGVLGAAHDEAGARAGEGLVRGARDDVAVRAPGWGACRQR